MQEKYALKIDNKLYAKNMLIKVKILSKTKYATKICFFISKVF